MAQRPTGVRKSEARTSPVRFRHKHLLSIADLDRFEAESLLDRAEAFAPLAEKKIKKLDTLRGRTLINLFFENSTRTQSSFELAGKRMGADVVNMSVKSSSVAKGETLIDTATTLNAMRPDLLVVRHGQYLGYINDQLVAIIDASGASANGHVSSIGLDVEDNTTTGVFNDFAIYPAPPPYQPLLHG